MLLFFGKYQIQKDSWIGLQVQDRMRSEGLLKGDNNRQILGRYYGARSPEVRLFMNNPNNYILEPASINRSNGDAMSRTYLPPATESKINKLFNINDLR